MATKPEAAVTINDIHKEFILPQSKNTSFKQVAVNIVKKNNKVTQKVLDGVSFTINKGDFFAIVGRNGSGKSTLLKLIAGVYSPTSGSIDLNGGLTPFIELGVGFNPELSGRDNVYLNGALLGYDRKQMDKMYDDIVEFAELEPFMDQKLKNYSSGMQVRLAFSIAIKAKNDILIFDEVLAVGDEAFQRKCLDVFEKYKAEGQTVILVTHEMGTVRQFCNRAALISDGKLVEVGDPQKVADHYSRLNQDVITKSITKSNANDREKDSGVDITCLNQKGKSESAFKAGETIRLRLAYKEDPRLKAFVVNVYKKSGEHLTGFRATIDDVDKKHTNSALLIDMPARFTKGKYRILVQLLNEQGRAIEDMIEGPEFMVTTDYIVGLPSWSGLVPVEHSISIEK